uniref:(northern house mosquito) hypothetical protein n=1 Tax=Culex pipiens TaxID=7175 RepID=A0A8D8BKQ4_CULPI
MSTTELSNWRRVLAGIFFRVLPYTLRSEYFLRDRTPPQLWLMEVFSAMLVLMTSSESSSTMTLESAAAGRCLALSVIDLSRTSRKELLNEWFCLGDLDLARPSLGYSMVGLDFLLVVRPALVLVVTEVAFGVLHCSPLTRASLKDSVDEDA